MKKETARKLFNRLNNNLVETLDILGFLESQLTEVNNERDYNIVQHEIISLNNKKQDLIIEMSKMQKSF